MAHGRQVSSSWRTRGQAGGPTVTVALSGSVAYVGVGLRLVIYDISGATPQEIGATPRFDDFVQDVFVIDGRAYVAAGSSGIHIFDVTTPASPRRVATWDSPGSAEAVVVDANVMYVADGAFGLQIVDLTDSSTPKPMASAFDEMFAFDVARSGNHAFVAAGGSGLLIVDVTNPRAPAEVARLDTPGYARRVALSGNTAILADQWEGVRVVDITDRARPVEIDSLALRSWAMDVVVEGSTAFVATGSAGLVTLDLGRPADVRQLGLVAVADRTDSIGVATRQGRAYVAAGRGGLQAFDVSSPAPRSIGGVTPLSSGFAVAISPPYVYVSDSSGLKVFDVSNADVPRETARLPTTSAPTSIAVAGSYVYFGTASPTPTLRVVDISDPRNPIEVAAVDTADAAYRDMRVSGDLLLASTESYLLIFHIGNPKEPRLLSKVPMVTGPLSAQGIGATKMGRYAFVAQSQAGVAVIDLVDPASPAVVAQFKPQGMDFAQAVANDGRYLYVATCGRLFVADAADPLNLRLSSTLGLPICPVRMTMVGPRLFIAAGNQGFAEVDISRPADPLFTGTIVLPGFAVDASSASGVAAVAMEDVGVFILTADGATSNSSPALPDTTEFQRQHPRRLWRHQAAASAQVSLDTAVTRPSATRSIVVTSSADDGPGTLRQAMATAMSGDVISFDPAIFPPTRPAAIRATTTLPLCASSVTIDASNAGVVLDGSMIPASAFTSGLHFCSVSSHVLIMGLQIINFPGDGIAVSGTDHTIGGDRSRGSGPVGQGNLASGNRASGVNLGPQARRTRIVGNLLGLPPRDLVLLYAQRAGVFFARASENILGGTSAAERNVISGNQIGVTFIEAGHNAVIGNYIGTDVTGTRIAPAGSATSSEIGADVTSTAYDTDVIENVIVAAQAVVLSDFGSSYNRILRNRIGIGPDGRKIEGTTTGLGIGISSHEHFNLIEGNVIGGLRSSAIDVNGPGDVFIIGNRIGTDPEGTRTIPNGTYEGTVLLRGARRAFVGGPSAVERNIVSGNNGPGIQLRGPGTDHNFIIGNAVGANGAQGIHLDFSSENVIQRNEINANRGAGIDAANGKQNTIRRNSISANEGPGIVNLGAPNAPVISVVALNRVDGTACGGCVVELFSDSVDEGRVYEGTSVATASGAFSVQSPRGVFVGPFVTATATDASGTTSNFSAPAKTLPPPARRRAVRL